MRWVRGAVNRMNVLVTASGGIVGQGILKCLKLANVRGREPKFTIVAADISTKASGIYRGDRGVLVRPASSKDYLDSILKVCKDHHVRAIFPGSEEELVPLAGSSAQIEDATGAAVIASDPGVLRTAMDKWRTFRFLDRNGLPCARSELPRNKESFVREVGYPVVVKPRQGHGSLHFYVAKNREEVDDAISAIEAAGWRPLLQEYLEGDETEFTSGVTIDKDGSTVMASISMKRRLKAGQTHVAIIDDFRDVRESAARAASRLGGTGPVNVQARLVDGVAKIFEINPRFSASCPMRAVAGVNEPDLTVRNWVLGERKKITKYRRLLCMRYLNEVYVPLSTYEMASKGGVIRGRDSFIPAYF